MEDQIAKLKRVLLRLEDGTRLPTLFLKCMNLEFARAHIEPSWMINDYE